ncbi:hypothetical protein A1O3_00094 [Capronia epimyces CBS 606.96]|uniref:Serine-rich protein n=1 Tax=Capronia epimyces CBS 606.96 TaxID=1182542 RepID=W9YQL2_9EURO|nr:uncharacterized protein A1O3_00094 [Capronia epimyces CBS 606.96]EXJ91546.1 hypothetical protein A1O3_00094 [Capronia epimyces CBS 606.96]
MAGRLHGLIRPKTRPMIEARKSHGLPGVGPLVSNPVRGRATAAAALGSRRQPDLPLHSPINHGRSVSAPLPPLDPRAHWAGMIEIHEQPSEDGRGSSYIVHHHHIRAASYGYSISRSESQNQSMIYHPNVHRGTHRWASSPHLHHDHRLNTGSTESRGFGYPFNIKSRWTAPSIIDESGRPWWSRADLRTAQIACFTTGFLFPLVWFVAAFLPLPRRPASMEDIEKAVSSTTMQEAQLQPQPQRGSISQQYPAVSEWEPMNVVDKLRLERQLAGAAELRWQNARWWRNLNRWMCIVGIVVCVVAIVLAVVGTQRNW